MKLKVMRTFIMTICVLAIATGGVGCKRDKDGNRAKGGRTGRTQKVDRSKQGDNKARGSSQRQQEQIIREKIAAKARRNQQRGSEPPTTLGGVGQISQRPPGRRRPQPRVHREWVERQYTADALAQAKVLAQSGLAQAVTHVGREGSQLIVTYRHAGEDDSQVSLVMVNVTGSSEGTLEGRVVRTSPVAADLPLGEGDPLTVAQADVVDWTLQVGDKAYGQFLRQASLEEKIEAGADKDGKSAAKLAELRADLPSE